MFLKLFLKHHGLAQIQENTYTIADKIFWTPKITKNFMYLK